MNPLNVWELFKLDGNYGDSSQSMYSVVVVLNDNPPSKASVPLMTSSTYDK